MVLFATLHSAGVKIKQKNRFVLKSHSVHLTAFTVPSGFSRMFTGLSIPSLNLASLARAIGPLNSET